MNMMDNRSSKKILFNKSTLLSLKAELMKKQAEVKEKKHLPQHRVENYKPPPPKKEPDKEPKKTFKESLKAVDTEEIEACRKAKAILEKKAELYDHLADGTGNSQLAGQFLVDFNTKKQQDTSNQSEDEGEYDDDHHDYDDEWTEYRDCLGRSRKCLKSDLHLYTKKDEELRQQVLKVKPTPVENNEQSSSVPSSSSTQEEKSILAQKTQDYLHSLRAKWERKERELMNKDKDVHYQDILFDEARQHGVGYYSFSTDETERRQQMADLKQAREETLRAQRDTELARKQRDELMAKRVAAARARQRERAGLPPEEPKDNTEDFTSRLLEFLSKQKDEADLKAKEKEKMKKEEKEKERQKLREAYIRDWDVGKEGVEGKPKKFVEMSQEEYVEQQRAKRIDEFGPQRAAETDRSQYTFDEHGRRVSGQSTHKPTKTWSEVRPEVEAHQRFDHIDINDIQEQKGLYFSSSTKNPPDCKSSFEYGNFVRPQATTTSNESTQISQTATFDERNDFKVTRDKHEISMKYKNFAEFQPKPETNKQEPVWILNEISDDDEDPTNEDSNHMSRENSTGEIPPPPTYDYYGPVTKKPRHERPFNSDMNESFAQGSKSLQPKSDGRKISHQYDFSLE